MVTNEQIYIKLGQQDGMIFAVDARIKTLENEGKEHNKETDKRYVRQLVWNVTVTLSPFIAGGIFNPEQTNELISNILKFFT